MSLTLDGTLGLNSINIGANIPGTGAFTTLSASSTVSGSGFSTYLASPPAIGGTTAATGTFTNLTVNGNTILGGTSSNTVTLNAATVTLNNSTIISAASTKTLTLNGGGLTNGLVLDASNNVGIGTSSPGAKLEISLNGTSGPKIRLVNPNATSRNTGIQFAYGATPTVGWQIGTDSGASGGGELFFATGDGGSFVSRMTLDSSGKLSVNGTIQIATGTTTSAGSIFTNVNYGMLFQAYQASPALADFAWFNSAGTERGRIDSSGNLGIGQNSPTAKIQVYQTSTTAYGFISNTPTVGLTAGNYVNMAYFANGRSTNGDGLRIVNVRDSTGSGVGNWETESYRIRRSVDQNDGAAGVQEEIVFGNNLLTFNTAGTERGRIDSSGNLLVGCTSINPLGSTRLVLSENSGTTKWAVGPIDIAVNNFYVFAATGAGVFLSGTSATSWSSNSDERLKTDLKPIENAAQKVSTLRAVTGRYKTDVEGFSRAFLIAQDVQKVLPEAVGYTKLVGADDETDYLALAYTDTIPLLVAAIKELTTRLEALEAK
jgi:hypothetical protein